MHTNTTWLRGCVSAVALAALTTPLLATSALANSVHNYIESSASDAEERASGVVDTKEQVIELGYERGRQTVGLRYTLNIKPGSKINSAKLVMQAAKPGAGSTSLVIRAQDTDNASAFAQSTRNISGRSKTGASVKWSPAATKVNGALTSPNIASVIQEVVNRKGFDSGNEVAIIISTTGGTGVRPVHSLDGSGKAPILIVDYTPGKGISKPATPDKTPTTPKPPKGNDGGSEEVPVDDTDLTPSNGSGINPDVLQGAFKLFNQRAIATVLHNASKPNLKAWDDSTAHAKSCDEYRMSRMLNSDVLMMQLAWRKTGDIRYLDEVDRLMQIVRGCLSDSNRDGFKNFIFKKAEGDATIKKLIGTDNHHMEEQLMHGWLASATWDLKRSGKKAYAEHVRFWTDYLKNDFEAKWRKRNHTKSGDMKFLQYWLFHPYNHFTRYYYSMAKLTGNNAYMVEAKARAAKIHDHFREKSTPKGTAYIWGHKVGVNQKTSCAPTPYVSFAVQAMVDLNDAGLISDADMKKVALNMSQLFVRKDLTFAANSCGDAPKVVTHKMVDKNGRIYYKTSTYGGEYFAKNDTSLGVIVPFDSSGDMRRKLDTAYAKVSKPGGIVRQIGLSISMLLAAAK